MRVLNRKNFLAAFAAALRRGHAADGAHQFQLKNDFFDLLVAAGPAGVWIQRLALNQEPTRPGSGFTGNLCASSATNGWLRSGTAILAEGLPWQFSRTAATANVTATATSLRIDDVLIGPDTDPLAREAWEIELAGRRLSWRIERKFLREIRVVSDRFPAFVFRTRGDDGSGRKGFIEIPGFLDPDMHLDRTRGFNLPVPGEEWREAVSPNRVQEIHLAPSGIVLASRMDTGLFSYAKQPADGTAAVVAVGAKSAGPSSATQQKWELSFTSATAPAPLDLTLPDPFLTAQTRSFSTVHNQWMGWIIANNPASAMIPHEMGWYPMMQSIYARDTRALAAQEKLLAFVAEHGVEENGYVLPRWHIGGFYRVVWGNLHDQVPHFVLAMYHYALNSGSRDFIRRVMPVLDRVTAYMVALDRDHDGVAEIPNTSGLPNGLRDCSNWYDIIKFGHKDAYIGAYCCAALGAMAQLKGWIGDAAAAEQHRTMHRRWVDGFNRVFWDKANGFYFDWIDERERMPESARRYFYTDPNLLAILFGIADSSKTQSILRNLDARYESLCRERGLAREAIWATPCNMIPVTQLGDLVEFGKLGNQKVFPNYENGCSFFHTTGFEIAARAMAGQPEQAYQVFDRVMRHGYARNRLWAAALKWDTGELISEPLNNALMILWGFIRGCLGIHPTLERCEVHGSPSPQMEGARFRFCHLGKDVTVQVRNGKTTVSE